MVGWLNNNAGLVTAAGFMVAVVTGVLAYVSFSRGRRVFHVLLFEALYEALHNLHHLANSYKEEITLRRQPRPPHELKRWPEYDLRYAERILAPPYVDHLHVTLRSYLDHMLRNDNYIRQLPRTASAVGKAAANVGYLVELAMRLLVEARHRQEPEAIAIFDYLEKEGNVSELTNLRCGLHFPRCAIRLTEEEAEVYANEHAHEVGHDAPRVYWFNNEAESTLLYDQLVSLHDPPYRAPRPNWVARLYFRFQRFAQRTQLLRINRRT